MSIEAMKLALEALEKATPVRAKDPQMQADAIAALRTAIEQSEKQEPVAWIHKETGLLRREISRPKGADWDANYWQPLYATTQPDQRISDDPIYIASDGGFYPMPRQRKPLEGEEP